MTTMMPGEYTRQQVPRELPDADGEAGTASGARPSLAFTGEPARVREADRLLERLEGLPAAQHGAILATGLAAITHAILALRETVADNGSDLASILDPGLAGISDAVSETTGATSNQQRKLAKRSISQQFKSSNLMLFCCQWHPRA
jgi:hypothetical protein